MCFASNSICCKLISVYALQLIDHNVQDHSDENRKKYSEIRAFAKKHGVDFFPAGRGTPLRGSCLLDWRLSVSAFSTHCCLLIHIGGHYRHRSSDHGGGGVRLPGLPDGRIRLALQYVWRHWLSGHACCANRRGFDLGYRVCCLSLTSCCYVLRVRGEYSTG